MAHSSSRTWISPRVRNRERYQAQEHLRRKICPKSPFWHADFDLATHRKEWEAGRLRAVERKMTENFEATEERRKLHGKALPPLPLTPEAFAGKKFYISRGTVLSFQTVFCPAWEKCKADYNIDTAPWPSKQEMRYEGEDRISTDRLHRRFLPAPRKESNETVNWQHRDIIGQFFFDDFYFPIPDAVAIFMRTHRIADSEFSDVEGTEAIGTGLMGLLDPQDQ